MSVQPVLVFRSRRSLRPDVCYDAMAAVEGEARHTTNAVEGIGSKEFDLLYHMRGSKNLPNHQTMYPNLRILPFGPFLRVNALEDPIH